VAHNYFGVSDEIVWDVVENEIPPLLEKVKVMLSEKRNSLRKLVCKEFLYVHSKVDPNFGGVRSC
jgi:hypothetical protein